MESFSARTWPAALLVCFLILPAVYAQTQAPAPERRTIVVSVVDKEGNFVEGLTAEDFRGEFRGQPVTIDSAMEHGGTKYVVVLLDSSASSRDLWRRTWAALEDLMVSLPSPHQLVVCSFGETLSVLGMVPAGGGLDRAKAMLGELQRKAGKPGGATSLYDALVEVTNLRVFAGAPDALYVISDGMDTTSRASRETVQRRLAARGLRTFFLLLPSDPDRGSTASSRARRDVSAAAESSGGVVFDFSRRWPPGDDPLSSIRPQYLSMVRTYTVSFTLPTAVDKPSKWKLELVNEKGQALAGVELLYPHTLAPPERPED